MALDPQRLLFLDARACAVAALAKSLKSQVTKPTLGELLLSEVVVILGANICIGERGDRGDARRALQWQRVAK